MGSSARSDLPDFIKAGYVDFRGKLYIVHGRAVGAYIGYTEDDEEGALDIDAPDFVFNGGILSPEAMYRC